MNYLDHNELRLCQVDNCENPLRCRGMCTMHYQRFMKGLPLEPPAQRPPTNRICSVETCNQPVHGKGLCSMHKFRQDRGQNLTAPSRYGQPKKECSTEECEQEAVCKGLCKTCYHRKSYPPFTERRRGVKTSNYNSNGYKYISIPKGHPFLTNHGTHISVHRLVYSEFLGRKLMPGENIHHINGIRDDNRLENLELWNTAQPRGQRAIDKLAWAREIIALYEPDEEKINNRQLDSPTDEC